MRASKIIVQPKECSSPCPLEPFLTNYDIISRKLKLYKCTTLYKNEQKGGQNKSMETTYSDKK